MYFMLAPFQYNRAPTEYIMPPKTVNITPFKPILVNKNGKAIKTDQPLIKWQITDKREYLSIFIEVKTIPTTVMVATIPNIIQPSVPPIPSNDIGIYVPNTNK